MRTRAALPAALTAAVLAAGVAGCGGGSGGGVAGGDPGRAPAAFAAYGCGACHTIAGIDGANADVGPPLRDFGDRDTIAGILANTGDNLVRWIRFPQQIDPGSVMPDMGVSEQAARDIAAYLYRH
jgi:cytochrome c1